MSFAQEIFNSREGVSKGYSGPRNVTRSFRVTVDNVEDDPSTVSGLPPIGEIWLGFQVPVIASDYVLRRRLTRLTWLIDVLYIPDIEFATTWRMQISGGSEGRKLLETLDNDPNNTKPIGPNIYQPVDQSIATHSATDRNNRIVYLKQTPARKVLGYDGETPSGTLTFMRSQANFSEGNSESILSFLTKVNSGPFVIGRFSIGAAKGVFKFVSTVIEDVPGFLPNQNIPGTIWSIQLSFAYNADKHSPISFIHTWEDDRGYESRISKISGGLEVEDFIVKKEANFNNLIGLYGN